MSYDQENCRKKESNDDICLKENTTIGKIYQKHIRCIHRRGGKLRGASTSPKTFLTPPEFSELS